MTVERCAIIAELQRELVPFLAAAEIDRLLARVEADGALADHASDGRFDPVGALNACLFDHPAFTDELARRDRRSPAAPPRTLRIAQRIHFATGQLPERSVLELTLPAPRTVPGVQRTRLVAANPAGLAEHVLARAGLVYGVPLVIEAGRELPTLELVYEVERTGAPYRGGLVGVGGATPGAEAAAWAASRGTGARGPALVAALVAALEAELQTALVGRVANPARTLLAAGAGDPMMHAALLAEALASRGVVARLGAAQRLYLDDGGTTRLVYPGSAAFAHPFVEWRDPEDGATGIVDLSYLVRGGQIAAHLDPEVVIAGVAGASRIRVLASGAIHPVLPPIDRVELAAEVLP